MSAVADPHVAGQITGATRAVSARAVRLEVAKRTWPSVLAGAGAAAIVLWLAFHAGGYFAPDFLLAGAVALGLCALVLILRPPLYLVSGEALVALAVLAGLAIWTAWSTRWSLNPSAGLQDMQRDITYLALFGLGLAAAGSGRLARGLVRLIGAVALAIVIAGLVHRLLPAAAENTPPLGYRLSYPLTYWNAYGALAAVTAVLAVGLAAERGTALGLRGAAAGGAVLAAVGMYMSLSRGAWLAMGAGLLVLIAVHPRRRALLATLALVGAVVALALMRLSLYPGLVDNPRAGSGQIDAGHVFAPQLLGLALIAAGGQILIALAGRRVVPPRWMPSRRVFGAAGAVLALAAVGGYAALAARVDGRAAGGLSNVRSYVDRQWSDFLAAAPTTATGSERLASTQGSRSEVYRVALDGLRSAPIAGTGAGSFRVLWVRDRHVDETVLNAHSLYLETLSDTGLIGFALLLAFLATLAVAAVRSRRRPVGLARGEAAAVMAACAVWIVHSGVDWDWQMPALTGTVLVLAATLYPSGRPLRRRSSRLGPRAAMPSAEPGPAS